MRSSTSRPRSCRRRRASRDDALLAMVTGWMMHCGPITSAALAYWLGLPPSEIEQGAAAPGGVGIDPARQLHADRQRSTEPGTVEWCDRRLLARIHHLTVATLRKQVEPVTAAQYMRWLLRWQHVAPQSQLAGERGLLEAVRQLQGFEIPANAWERHILGARVSNYDPAALDQLCLTGAVGWGRLSPHPATLEDVRRRPAARGADQRCADHVLRPRGRRLDAAAPERRRSRTLQRVLSEIGAQRPGIPAASRSVVLRRHRARHSNAESRNRDGALGTGRCRDGHRRRLRKSALADRSAPPQCDRHAEAGQAAPHRRTLVACCIRRTAPTAARSSRPPAGCCCAATAWSSARCWRASRTCPSGASC